MEYLYVIIFFIILFILAYIKIRYPFWNIQPVYHYYDFWVPINREPYIVYKYRPILTKFCDFVRIKTFLFSELTEEQLHTLTDLIQCFTIYSDKILYVINKENISTYLTGQNATSIVSFYKDVDYVEIKDASNNNLVHVDSQIGTFMTEYKGCITSRLIKIFVTYNNLSYDAFYIDYITIHRDYSDPLLSRKLLQSHEYNQQVLNPAIKISILRKEIDLYGGVVPVVEFTTALYQIRDIKLPKLPPHFTVERIFKEHLNLLTNFFDKLENMLPTFKIKMFSEMGNIMALIKKELLYVFCLKRRDQVFGIYFLKDAHMQYDGSTDDGTLHLLASFHNSTESKLFTLGFMYALQSIQKFKRGFKTILIDNIGHNCFIDLFWRRKYSPLLENKTAYYSFNFILPLSPYKKEEVFVLL